MAAALAQTLGAQVRHVYMAEAALEVEARQDLALLDRKGVAYHAGVVCCLCGATSRGYKSRKGLGCGWLEVVRVIEGTGSPEVLVHR